MTAAAQNSAGRFVAQQQILECMQRGKFRTPGKQVFSRYNK